LLPHLTRIAAPSNFSELHESADLPTSNAY
jgi:hypothetical protein